MMIPTTGKPSKPSRNEAAQQMITFQSLLLDHIQDAIIGTNVEDRVTYWNQAAERLYGWKFTEVQGQFLTSLLQPEEVTASDRPPLESREDLTSTARIVRHRTREGRLVHVEVVTLPLLDSQGRLQGYGYSIRHVTEPDQRAEDREVEKSADLQHSNEAEATYPHDEAVLESIQDMFYSVDRDWRFTYVNQKAEAQWRQTREALIGRTVWEVFPEVRDSDPYQQLQLAMQNRQVIHFEALSPVLNTWVEIFAYPSADGGLAVHFHDITERKQADLSLALSEERFSKAFEIIPNGLVISRVEDGTILAANQYFEEMMGYRREEMIGKQSLALNMFANPEDRQLAMEKLKQENRLRHLEISIRTRSGEIRQVSLSSDLLMIGDDRCLLTMLEDVTERKQVEQKLQTSEARFRQLADAMPQLVWSALPDGSVDYYNRRYLEYNGIAPESGQRWEWGPVLHPEDLQPTLEAWQHAVQTGEMYQIEHRVRMSSGDYRWHLSRGVPARDETGNVIRWYGTATDIHDLKQAEASLAEYAERLQRSNHELEQFAFVASHDLQEPLRKIKLFSESIKAQLNGIMPEETADSFSRMQNAVERMQTMINGLLDLSRISTRGGNFQMVELDQVAREAITDLEIRILQKGALVNLGDLPAIEADPLQMRQLFQNLIANALKFHKPDVPPTITIRTMPSPPDKPDQVEIHLSDNGIGFEPQYADQIFQPFQRLHGRSEYEGTGMGLAICQKIVIRHHGQIHAESSPGQGATFIIHLPVHQPE